MDLEQIEAATGIRPRYLRAIEEEDWDALPEEFYARSFIRKYAKFVGVDPEPLVDEYKRRRGTDGRGGAPTSPFAQTGSRRAEALRRRRRRQGLYAWLVAGALAAAVVVAIVLISAGGGDGGSGPAAKSETKAPASKPKQPRKQKAAGNPAGSKTVELKLEPTAEVWTCLEDAKGRRLVDGQTLAAGEAAGPFRWRLPSPSLSATGRWRSGSTARRPARPRPRARSASASTATARSASFRKASGRAANSGRGHACAALIR